MRLTLKDKLLLAVGLNTFFFTVILYVNLDGRARSLTVIFGEMAPVLGMEFLVGVLIIFGWLFLAEWVHRLFERWFGEEIISKGGILPNVIALIVFSAINLAVNRPGLMLSYWLQTQLLDHPDTSVLGDSAYARMALRFNFAAYVIMSLFVYYLLTYRRIAQRMSELQLRAEKAQKAHIAAQYNILRSRVNPNFLFGSLKTLSSMIPVDGDRSEQFINRLSKAYRYMLDYSNRPAVPLQAELDFLKSYAFVLEARLAGKIQIRQQVPAQIATATQLAPLTLQVLIDKVLKNNQMTVQSPLIIEISATGNLLLVKSNRQPMPETGSPAAGNDWDVFENHHLLELPGGQAMMIENHDTYSIMSVPLAPVAASNPTAP